MLVYLQGVHQHEEHDSHLNNDAEAQEFGGCVTGTSVLNGTKVQPP